MIPIAVTQGNFFNSTRPMYLNFGAIGAVIGHELTHGFDNSGRKYDQEGKDLFNNTRSLKNFTLIIYYIKWILLHNVGNFDCREKIQLVGWENQQDIS